MKLSVALNIIQETGRTEKVDTCPDSPKETVIRITAVNCPENLREKDWEGDQSNFFFLFNGSLNI